MAGFTMPAMTLVTPSGVVDDPLGYTLAPDAGTTLRVSWTATGLVSFTGHFRNRSNNGLVGAQSFVNANSGSWLYTGDPNYNSTTPWGWEIDGITNGGHNITLTFSVDSGTPYSVLRIRRTGSWFTFICQIIRAGGKLFAPVYIRRTSAWSLVHK